MVSSLSKFVPKTSKDLKPHKYLKNGRFHFKGKRLGNPNFTRGKSGNPKGVANDPNENMRTRRKRLYKPTGRKVGNPNMKKGAPRLAGSGKKKGFTRKYKLEDLVQAIHEVEEEQDVEILKHFIQRALKSDPSMNNLMKKLLPDLKSVEAKGDVDAPFKLIIEMES